MSEYARPKTGVGEAAAATVEARPGPLRNRRPSRFRAPAASHPATEARTVDSR